MQPQLVSDTKRKTKLGCLGEQLAEEGLVRSGFVRVENLNREQANYRWADLMAVRDGKRYFIGVKARNEDKAEGGPNPSYNIVLISKAKDAELKKRGMTRQEITALLLKEVRVLAKSRRAIPAWVTVAVRPLEGTYAAYFGLLDQIGSRRSVPMLPKDRASYEALPRTWLTRE
jgi:hypothetical protein